MLDPQRITTMWRVGEYEHGQRRASIGNGPANQLVEKMMLSLPSNGRVGEVSPSMWW